MSFRFGGFGSVKAVRKNVVEQAIAEAEKPHNEPAADVILAAGKLVAAALDGKTGGAKYEIAGHIDSINSVIKVEVTRDGAFLEEPCCGREGCGNSAVPSQNGHHPEAVAANA